MRSIQAKRSALTGLNLTVGQRLMSALSAHFDRYDGVGVAMKNGRGYINLLQVVTEICLAEALMQSSVPLGEAKAAMSRW